MKSLLYFEYKKCRTFATILIIILILFGITNFIVYLSNQQSAFANTSFILDQVNYQDAYEKEETI